MKLVDMYFWQIGYEKDLAARSRGAAEQRNEADER
jgi:hypothetical protein